MAARIKNTNHRLIGLVALILYAIPIWANPVQAKTNHAKSSTDEQTLRDQASEYARAFSAADASTLANMWAPDGTFVDANGQEYQGRTAIEAMFINLFKQIGKQPLSISVESIRFPASTVAIEEGTSQMVKGAPLGSVGHYTVTHVKRNGLWQMDAVAETNRRNSDAPVLPESKLPDMSWMIGNWTATGKAETIHLHADWMPNHNQNFIKCTYSADTQSPPNDELQIIGWNPRTSQLNIWHYASNGGFGYGRLVTTDGQTWVERASSMQTDGTICSANYTLKKLNNDSFTWQSTHRNRGRASLPDTPIVTVQRDGSAAK
jgi:uncharacterized protein (TIGR02246 family)